MSLAHLTDTVGGYSLPHLITHAKTGLKSKDAAHMHRQFKHVLGHAQEIVQANKKLSKKSNLLPGVQKQNARLAAVRKQAK